MEVFKKSLANSAIVHRLFFKNSRTALPTSITHEPFWTMFSQSLDTSSWTARYDSRFVYFFPPNVNISDQGWKIHISGTAENFEEIIALSLPVLTKSHVAFKTMRKQFIAGSTRKESSRIQNGKFITIYPASTAQFRYLARTLAQRLQGLEGIPVLTDLEVLANSPVYYRYGGFVPHYLFDTEGDPIYAIYNTHGQLTPDRRVPGAAPPSDRPDPLAVTDGQWKNSLSNSKMQANQATESFFAEYDFTSVLSFSNYGRVYQIRQKNTGETAIAKEARAFIGNERTKDDVSARNIRHQEWQMLQSLADVAGVPNAIKYVTTDISDFLIEQHIAGPTLLTYRQRNPLYWAEPTETEFNLYAAQIVEIFDQLWEIMAHVHNHHIVLNDVKPENIIVGPGNRPFFIDLESARKLRQDPHVLPALFSWGYSDMIIPSHYTVAMDYEGLARCLLDMMITRAHEFNLGIEPAVQSLQFLQKVTQAWGSIPDALISVVTHRPGAITHLHQIITRMAAHSVSLPSSPVINHISSNKPHPDTLLEHRRYTQAYHTLLTTVQQMIQQNELPLTPYINNNPANFAYGLSGLVYGSHLLKINDAALDKEFHNEVINAAKAQNIAPFSLDRGQLGSLMTHYYVFRDTWSQVKLNGLFNRFFQTNNHSLCLFNGAAGIGQSALWLFGLTKDEQYRRVAKQALQEVLERPESLPRYGLGYGNSGVALFLTHYAEIFDQPSLLSTALTYWLTDYYQGTIASTRRVRGVAAGEHQRIPYIYIVHGTAGLIRTGLQILQNLPSQELDQAIQQLSQSLLVSSTINVGYLYGTGGLVSTLIELEKQYHQRKFKLAEATLLNSILSASIPAGNKMFLPSDANTNVGLDYGAGMIGDLLVMQKVVANRSGEFDPLFR
ncbi:hypothetical protein EFT87_02765 [Schleiferilactobacillus harbinensis]|uniref:class III lanthionine synthetase LanKC N-terminal domain-containing protein n=1 Tax=Schleiferilactobacillus harbinensis TaxID=304207 RepID=UPI0021A28A78|nr:lanthionine synthetase LanC family protein [Schleiferilactobacillus harbinensis]MCT2907586.1 hypothetical protein [Schleiferilactobacillus harbinensis]